MHHTWPLPIPRTPLSCTSVSGSVVEILDNSMHYQPQCQSTFVSCTAFIVAVFWGRILHTLHCAVYFLSHPCVSVYILVPVHDSVCVSANKLCMHLLGWWHVCACLNLKVSGIVCVCVFVHYSGITGCWAVLSVDSVVSFGPAAPSSVRWSDEIWQTGTVLSRPLPHPIVSPIMARLLQGHRMRSLATCSQMIHRQLAGQYTNHTKPCYFENIYLDCAQE